VTLPEATRARIRFLCSVVRKEVTHLRQTDERLFAQLEAAPGALHATEIEPLLAERIDAFVGRFGRLQDNVADKLLPMLLDALGEPRGPVIDNLDRAEKFGWIGSTDAWMEARRLRNLMVHEYIEDRTVLIDALFAGHAFVPALEDAAQTLIAIALRRID